MRLSFSFLYFSSSLAAALVARTAAAHPDHSSNATTIIQKRDMPNSQGTGSDNFFHSLWSSSSSGIDYTDSGKGSYYVKWSSSGSDNFVAGKGYAKGAPRAITYIADYRPKGNSYLSIYGWSRNPLREYYILENYGTYDPSSKELQYKGTVFSDGSLYKIYVGDRVNKPSIIGTATFKQYWSIRQTKRTAGTVTTGNHFNAWAKLGLQLGDHDYQIVATEGYGSSGESSVKIVSSYSAQERRRYQRWYNKMHPHH